MFHVRRPLHSAVAILSLVLGASACSTSGAGVAPSGNADAFGRAAQSHGGTSTPAPVTSPTNSTASTPAPVNPSPGPGVANISIVPGGGGSGVVTSTPAGIDCHQTSTGPTGQCGFNFPIGTAVELTGRPDPGSGFQGFRNCSSKFVVQQGGLMCQVLFT